MAMVWQRIRFALLAGALAAVAAQPARAGEGAPAAPPAPQFCTVRVTECVPEAYTCTRTVYKTECRTENYTAYRCECVPEERVRTFTVYKAVPETKTVTRSYTVCIPSVEHRTVMQPCYSYQPVTKLVPKWIDQGHYECREVPCHWKRWKNKLTGLFRKKCCEPCCPPPTKTVKVWVPCMVCVQVPVCCTERVCTYKPVDVCVTTYRQEVRTEACQVTCWKCQPQVCTEKCTVLVTRRVPYQATRTVFVCVPHQETVTLTRMVPRVVEKQVAVAAPSCAPTCCAPPCCEPCCPVYKCCKVRKCRFWRRGCCD
jgi:hypothetical protein